jgi:hypothetical protein
MYENPDKRWKMTAITSKHRVVMLKQDGVRLTPANYVKNTALMSDLLESMPTRLLKLGRELATTE